jgi:hypothetical protein
MRVNIVVPLAGPDFINQKGQIKGLQQPRGQPMLREVLLSRPWAAEAPSEAYHFALIDSDLSRQFARNYLKDWFPNCSITFLQHTTRGAALSALALCATLERLDAPLIIDLADILYVTNADITELFTMEEVGAAALTFFSTDSVYSYLEFDRFGTFLEAREKKVISTVASAGTYLFRSTATYIAAVAYALNNTKTCAYNDLFYVCPTFNGIRSQGLKVESITVTNVCDIKQSC